VPRETAAPSEGHHHGPQYIECCVNQGIKTLRGEQREELMWSNNRIVRRRPHSSSDRDILGPAAGSGPANEAMRHASAAVPAPLRQHTPKLPHPDTIRKIARHAGKCLSE